MNQIEHTVQIRGTGSHGGAIDPQTAGYTLMNIPNVVRDSIRMSVLRSSRQQRGPLKRLAPAWNRIEFKGQTAESDGSTLLHFSAPTLEQAAPQLFSQISLFEDIVSAQDTGFDLLGKMLRDIAMNCTDSERFDTPILGRIAKFSTMDRYGIDLLHFGGHTLDDIPHTEINAEVIATAQSLYQKTPVPVRVRISGQLDMIRISNRLFEIVLTDGERVRAVWTPSDVVELRDYLSKDVVVEGKAIYRPSGSLLRIDAEAIARTTAQDTFFSSLPKPSHRTLDLKQIRSRQNEKTGINAIWGVWEGEETEEDLLRGLEEIR